MGAHDAGLPSCSNRRTIDLSASVRGNVRWRAEQGGWFSGFSKADLPFAFWRGPRSHEVRFLFRLTVFAVVCGQAFFLIMTKRDGAQRGFVPSLFPPFENIIHGLINSSFQAFLQDCHNLSFKPSVLLFLFLLCFRFLHAHFFTSTML